MTNTRTTKQAAGGAFVWVFVSFSLLVAAFSSLDFLADPRYRDPLSAWLLEGGMLFACIGLWFQAKCNVYQVSLYLLVVASMTALTTGGVVLLASQWRPVAAMVCVLATALATFCLMSAIRFEDARFGRPRFSLAG